MAIVSPGKKITIQPVHNNLLKEFRQVGVLYIYILYAMMHVDYKLQVYIRWMITLHVH